MLVAPPLETHCLLGPNTWATAPSPADELERLVFGAVTFVEVPALDARVVALASEIGAAAESLGADELARALRELYRQYVGASDAWDRAPVGRRPLAARTRPARRLQTQRPWWGLEPRALRGLATLRPSWGIVPRRGLATLRRALATRRASLWAGRRCTRRLRLERR